MEVVFTKQVLGIGFKKNTNNFLLDDFQTTTNNINCKYLILKKT